MRRCVSSTERAYTVDGFAGEAGELCTSLACVKMAPVPVRFRPGDHFRAREIDSAIDQGLRRPFRAFGFCGVFDAELLARGTARLRTRYALSMILPPGVA